MATRTRSSLRGFGDPKSLRWGGLAAAARLLLLLLLLPVQGPAKGWQLRLPPRPRLLPAGHGCALLGKEPAENLR